MCVSSRPRDSEMICLRERQNRSSSSICWPRLRVARISDYSLLRSVLHARTDEEIYVKVPSGIKSSRFWRHKAAVNGTRKASKHQQGFSMRQARDKYAFPKERHQSVYLQAILRQFGLGTARRRFSGVWINIQIQESFPGEEG